MKPLLRDVIRPLLNPAVVGTLVVLVVFSVILAPPVSSSRTSVNLTLTSSYSSGYHFTGFAFDGAGTPVAGVTLSLNFSRANANGSGISIGEVSGVTASDGFVRLNWSAPYGAYTVQGTVTRGPSFTAGVPMPAPNVTARVLGVIYVVDIGQFVVVPELLVSFANTNGSIPAGLRLLYSANDSAPWNVLGTVTSNPQIFPLPERSLSSLPPGQTVYFQLGNASTEVEIFEGTASSFLNTSGSSTPAGSALLTAVQDLSLFVPLAAVFVGYTSYGRERLTGALEPVLALPVSRSGLFVQRMLGATLATVAGTTAATLVFVELLAVRTGVSFPYLVWIGLWGSVTAMSVVFLALALLLAHLLRTPGALLGTGLAIALIGSVFWGLLTDLAGDSLGVFTGSLPSSSTTAWQAWVGLLNPITVCQSIVSSATLASSPPGAAAVIPIVTPAIVWVVVLVLWMALPLTAGLAVAAKRD
jgi:ABC-type transport system involved in multi-copper enzyme maturation permease subunit